MKTRLLWALILAVGGTALYFGLARPVVLGIPRSTREYLATDPAKHPPIKLPPLVVSESRLPVDPREPTSPHSQETPTDTRTGGGVPAETPGLDASGMDTAPGGTEPEKEATRESDGGLH